MCGRYAIISPPETLRRLFGYSEQPNFPPRYNIAPTQPVPVVISDREGRHFHLVRWGLLPAWVKDPRPFALLINARSETAREKPAFKNAIKRRRCLLPADGYYEWQTFGKSRQPYFIHRRDGQPFGFAGLAETWVGPNGEELDTVAIITAPASGELAALHTRVPMIITPDAFARWMDCDQVSVDEAMSLLTAPCDGAFVWHAVSRKVNHVANDEAQLVLPMSEQEIVAEAAASIKPVSRKPVAVAPVDDGQGSLF